MKSRRTGFSLLLAIALPLLPLQTQGQEETEDEGLITLSDFEVNADQDVGYGVVYSIGGMRINMPVLDIANSIITVNRQFMDDVGTLDLDESLKYISGTGTDSSPQSGNIVVRGFASKAVFRDGFPLGPGAGNLLRDMDLFERIEVLKGAEGTLYGQHSLGGIQNYVTKRAQSVRQTTIKLSAGDFEHFKVFADTTGPIDKDKKWTYRLMGSWQDAQQARGNANDRRFASAMLQFRPNENSRIWATYVYDWADFYTSHGWWMDVNGNNSRDIFGHTAENHTGPFASSQRDWAHFIELGYSTTFDLFQNPWEMRIVSRYQRSWSEFEDSPVLDLAAYDAAGNKLGNSGFITIRGESGAANAIAFDDPRVADIRAAADERLTPRHRFDKQQEYGVWVDFTGELDTGGAKHRLINYLEVRGSRNPGSDIFDAAYNDPTFSYSIIPNRTSYEYTRSELVTDLPFPSFINKSLEWNFAWGIQDNVSFLDGKLLFVGGLRFDWQSSESSSATFDSSTGEQLTSQGDGSGKDSDVVPKYAVIIKPVEGVALFYNHSETFIPVTGVSAITRTPFENQVGTSDEVGVKFALMENRLVLTGSYFDNELTNQFESNVVQGGGGQSERTQTAFTKVDGWEIDGRWAPTDNINLLFGLGDYSSKNKEGKETRNALQGFNFTIFGTYRFTEGPLEGLFAGLGHKQTAKRINATQNRFTRHFLPKSNITDAVIGYGKNNWKVQLNIYNLTDENEGETAILSGFVYPYRPRNYRVTFQYTF